MLLYIHNLPSYFGYLDIERLLREKCGLTSVILDDLVNQGAGSRVTVGLADEVDAAILARKINGFYFGENQLFVEDVRKNSPSDQPYRQTRQHNQDPLLNQDHMDKGVLPPRRPEPFAAPHLQTPMHYGQTIYNNAYNNPVEQPMDQSYRSSEMRQQNQNLPLRINHPGNNVPRPILPPFADSHVETPMYHGQGNFTPNNGFENPIEQHSGQPYRGSQMGQQIQNAPFNRDYMGQDMPPYTSGPRAPLHQRPMQYDQTPHKNAFNNVPTGQAMYPLTQARTFGTTVNQAQRIPVGQQKYEPEDSLLPDGDGYNNSYTNNATFPSSRDERVSTQDGRGRSGPGRGNSRFESERIWPRNRETQRPRERSRSPRYDAATRDTFERRVPLRRDVNTRDKNTDSRFAAKRDTTKRPSQFSDAAGPPKPKYSRNEPGPRFSSSLQPERNPHQEYRREPYTGPPGGYRPPVANKNVPSPMHGSALLTDLVRSIDTLRNTFGPQQSVHNARSEIQNRFSDPGFDPARRNRAQHPISPWGTDFVQSGPVPDLKRNKLMTLQKLQNKDWTNRQTAVSEIMKRISYSDHLHDMTDDIPSLKFKYKEFFLRNLKSELRRRVDRMFQDKLIVTKEEIVERYEKLYQFKINKKLFKQITGDSNIQFVAKCKEDLKALDKNIEEWKKHDGTAGKDPKNEPTNQSDPKKMSLFSKWLLRQQEAITHNLFWRNFKYTDIKRQYAGLRKLLVLEIGYHDSQKIDLRETLEKDTLSGCMVKKNVLNLLQIVPVDKNELPDFDAMENFLKPCNVLGLRRFKVLDMYLAYFETDNDLMTLKKIGKSIVDGKMVKFEPLLHNFLDPAGNIIQDKLPPKSVPGTNEKGQDITKLLEHRLRQTVKDRPKWLEDHLKVMFGLRTRVMEVPAEDANAKKLMSLKAVFYREFHYLEKKQIDKEQALKNETLSSQVSTYKPEDDNILQIIATNNGPLPNFHELNAFLQPYHVKGLRRFISKDMYLALLATKEDCEKLYAMGPTEVGSKRVEFKQFPNVETLTVQVNTVVNMPNKKMPVSQIHESLIECLKNKISTGKGGFQTLKELLDEEMSYHRENNINIEDSMMFDTFSKHLREGNTLDLSKMLIVAPKGQTEDLVDFNPLNNFLKPHKVIGLRKFLVIKAYVALFETKQDYDKMVKLGTASIDGKPIIFKPFTEKILKDMLQSSKTDDKPKINKPVQKPVINNKDTNASINNMENEKPTKDTNKLSVTDTSSKGSLTTKIEKSDKGDGTTNDLSKIDSIIKEETLTVSKDSEGFDNTTSETYEQDDIVEPAVDDKLADEDLDVDLDDLEDY